MTAPTGSNPALQPLAALVGEWQTTGTHPLLPGKVFHGRTTFAWHEGGAFLIVRSEIDEPEIPNGVAIYGSDDEAGTYFSIYFDVRGVSRKYDVTVDGNTVTSRRDSPHLSQRNTLSIDADGTRMVSAGEMSRDGGEWEGDLSLTYVRVQ